MVGLLEERYAIQIDDEDLIPENLDSINGLRRFVQMKLRAAQPEGEELCR